ncbi:Charged multivesicular body protein 6 AltName: Full=Chromatin-modifying protein 6 [Rhizoctonia solani AG-1 IB]|uniref:Rhizoctonia solani AG1-IB WGS project CAOJ00000000 data, isolate 7/3/14, contig 18976 n=1 Tax=Thanatephorus cucumeris (strain AG1-IB / isolate 7/3/14) TaxID=1108050 RepID=M5C510_THACB|nr:Charged multivesicular body protein 6 AltName: Full=Chromatin-modifying protein 6 [Rhizoctonia solani AG-1 IB]
MGGKQSVPKVSAQDRAIVDLKNQRDEIQVILDREHAIAKEALANGNKRVALIALRRRKYQESMLQKTDGQLETLEGLVSSIEFALVEKDIIFGLQQGNQVLKALHAEMSLEDVEKLMEETAEAVAYQNEIDQMLTSQMTVDEEEAVQKELEQLQAEALGSAPIHEPSPPEPVKLPSVPTAEPTREEASKEDEQRVALPA